MRKRKRAREGDTRVALRVSFVRPVFLSKRLLGNLPGSMRFSKALKLILTLYVETVTCINC